MFSIDDLIAAIAAGQHGLVARHQLRGKVDRRAVQRRITSAVLVEESPNVLRLAGAPRSDLQRVEAGVLDVPGGASASHRTAAWLWRLPGFPLRSIEVTSLRDRWRQSPLAVVHQPRLLLPEHLTRWRGIEVTTVARTIYDLAGCIHPERLVRLIASVCSRSPAVHGQLHDMLPVMAASGRTGITSMRGALGRWPRGCALPGSGQEIRFEEIMSRYGITGLRRQVDLGGHSWIGRVDYLCDETNLVFEIDSELHHTSPVDVAEDARRDAALLAAGFADVVRIWTETLWRDPADVAAQVRAARRLHGGH